MNQHGHAGTQTEHLQGPCGLQCGFNRSWSGPHALDGSAFNEWEESPYLSAFFLQRL